MVQFRMSQELSQKIGKLFFEQKRRILKLLPYAKVKHIGSTALPSALTKGDLDVLVRVPQRNFKQAVSRLKKIYKINQPRNWTKTYASFKDNRLKFGLQLVYRDIVGFTKHVNLLKKNLALLKNYNSLKRKHEGKSMKEYRKAKEKFFKDLQMSH